MSGIARKLLLLVVAVVMALAFAQGTSSAAEPVFGYRGFAFGTSVDVAGTITSGQTAVVSFGCGSPVGLAKSANTAGATVPGVLSAGTTVSTGSTSATPVQSRTSNTVQEVNLLGGLVTAEAVTSVATASYGAGQFGTSAAGTTFANLQVLGIPIDVNVAPNTKITLPLIGRVVLNEQQSTVNGNSADLRVNAIHIKITVPLNPLGLAVGTNILVAVATAGLSSPAGGFLSGFSYGTQVTAAGLLSSSRTFLATLPCPGTNGVLRSNTGVGVTLPLLLNSGTITDTVQGSTTATTADGESTSTIEDLNVLNGLITATGVRSVATAHRAGGVTTLSSAGSTFATISVNGSPLIVADIAPNTVINILGVGTLYLNRVFTNATGIEVRAIELVIKVAQIGGLPIGAHVYVAVANASAR